MRADPAGAIIAGCLSYDMMVSSYYTVNVCVRRTGHTRVDATQQSAGPAGLKCTSSTRAPATHTNHNA
eukprot:7391480-Prymnesium_polylepis.3